MRSPLTWVSLAALIFMSRCNSDSRFDSKKWKIEEDLETYPFRESMLNNIIQSKMLIGMNYRSVIDSLGDPNGVEGDQSIYYLIETDYGRDIDPVYTKSLVLKLSDSVVLDAKVHEWNKFKSE